MNSKNISDYLKRWGVEVVLEETIRFMESTSNQTPAFRKLAEDVKRDLRIYKDSK